MNDNIKDKIYIIKNVQIILDEDLAILYNVETKALNQAVKSNIDRFPENFMFQLSKKESRNLRSQFVTSRWGGRRKLSYAFTEQWMASHASIASKNTRLWENKISFSF